MKHHTVNSLYARITIAFFGAVVLAAGFSASCNIDGIGYLCSESSPDARFTESRSMAQPDAFDPGADFSFIFVSDLHIENGQHAYLRGLKDKLDGAAFVVIGGDISQNGKIIDIDEFSAAAATFGIPVYPVIGNHDLYNGGWNQSKAVGPSSFTVQLGPEAKLVCLDSANGTLGSEQESWLEEVLSQGTEPTIIVATHMQFFTSSYLETQQYTTPEETALLLSLYKDADVDLVLAGHSHKADMKQIGSMQYWVSGSFLDGSSSASYLYVTCSDGKISVERRKY